MVGNAIGLSFRSCSSMFHSLKLCYLVTHCNTNGYMSLLTDCSQSSMLCFLGLSLECQELVDIGLKFNIVNCALRCSRSYHPGPNKRPKVQAHYQVSSINSIAHSVGSSSSSSWAIVSSLRSPNVLSLTTKSSSFSHGFLRLLTTGWVARSDRTVDGISLMPGMGLPDVIRATISAKGVGYGGFSSAGGNFLAVRWALYAPKSTGGMFFFRA